MKYENAITTGTITVKIATAMPTYKPTKSGPPDDELALLLGAMPTFTGLLIVGGATGTTMTVTFDTIALESSDDNREVTPLLSLLLLLLLLLLTCARIAFKRTEPLFVLSRDEQILAAKTLPFLEY